MVANNERAIEITPQAVGLYTSYAKAELGFNWHIKPHKSSIFKQVEETYRVLLREKFGEFPRIAVYIGSKSVGLVIAEISTTRKDIPNAKRFTKDTLYLEFGEDNQATGLMLAANLLYVYDENPAAYEEYLKFFLDYAEKLAGLFETNQFNPQASPGKIIIPNYTFDERKIVRKKYTIPLPNDRQLRQEFANYFQQLSKEEKSLPKSFVFVSTGRVDEEDIQKYLKIHTDQELNVLWIPEDAPDKEMVVQGHHAAGIVQTGQAVMTQVIQTGQAAFMTQVVQPVVSYVQNVFIGNPPAIDQPTGKTPEVSSPTEIQPKTASDSQEEKSTDAKKSSLSKGEQTAAGGLVLLAIGSLFLTMLDRTPPQLASLMLQSSNLMQAVQTPLPRFGDFGKAQLTFSEAVQGVALSNQVCEKADDAAKTWECAVALSSDNPNQVETLTLTVADVKDDAGNVMPAKTITAQIESADIRAELLDASRTVQKDGAAFAVIQVKASAKYGVKAVTMLGVPAAQTQTPEVWQAEIPLASAPNMPLTAVILDKHDNALRVRLP